MKAYKWLLIAVAGMMTLTSNAKESSKATRNKCNDSACCCRQMDMKCQNCGKAKSCCTNHAASKKEQMKMEVMKQYSCPMHPDEKSNTPGKCSKCGMDMNEVKKMDACCAKMDMKCCKACKCEKCCMTMNGSKKETDKTATVKKYSCPMHPAVVSDKPGKCSECGMELQENKNRR